MTECSYCKSQIVDGATHCQNCGAPAAPAEGTASDFRSCPYCGRKLLALASPACNYCGRRLPEDYIKARKEDLQRMGQIGDLVAEEESPLILVDEFSIRVP